MCSTQIFLRYRRTVASRKPPPARAYFRRGTQPPFRGQWPPKSTFPYFFFVPRAGEMFATLQKVLPAKSISSKIGANKINEIHALSATTEKRQQKSLRCNLSIAPRSGLLSLGVSFSKTVANEVFRLCCRRIYVVVVVVCFRFFSRVCRICSAGARVRLGRAFRFLISCPPVCTIRHWRRRDRVP